MWTKEQAKEMSKRAARKRTAEANYKKAMFKKIEENVMLLKREIGEKTSAEKWLDYITLSVIIGIILGFLIK